jgi:hypothetical protein
MTFSGDVKRWWNSRTIWLGNLLVVFGLVLEYVNANSAMLTPYFGKWGGAASVAIGVLTIILRRATTAPICEKQ